MAALLNASGKQPFSGSSSPSLHRTSSSAYRGRLPMDRSTKMHPFFAPSEFSNLPNSKSRTPLLVGNQRDTQPINTLTHKSRKSISTQSPRPFSPVSLSACSSLNSSHNSFTGKSSRPCSRRESPESNFSIEPAFLDCK